MAEEGNSTVRWNTESTAFQLVSIMHFGHGASPSRDRRPQPSANAVSPVTKQRAFALVCPRDWALNPHHDSFRHVLTLGKPSASDDMLLIMAPLLHETTCLFTPVINLPLSPPPPVPRKPRPVSQQQVTQQFVLPSQPKKEKKERAEREKSDREPSLKKNSHKKMRWDGGRARNDRKYFTSHIVLQDLNSVFVFPPGRG